MSDLAIRPVREDELAEVLQVCKEAGVTPPCVTDSIEGLTRLVARSARKPRLSNIMPVGIVARASATLRSLDDSGRRKSGLLSRHGLRAR